MATETRKASDTNYFHDAPLFLIGSGRSGTTLIQRVLNTLPGVIIWGEHVGALEDLAKLYVTLMDDDSLHEFSYSQLSDDKADYSLDVYKDPKTWQAWMNWFRPEDLPEIFRSFLRNLFLPPKVSGAKVWGFKEIRYHGNGNVLRMLRELYPAANFIIITREPLNTIESQMSTFYRGRSRYPRLRRLLDLRLLMKVARRWKHQNTSLLRMCMSGTKNTQMLRYEELVDDLSLLDTILETYGLRISDSQLSVLQESEGRGTGYSQEAPVNERWRRMGIVPALCTEAIVGGLAKQLGYARPRQLAVATWLGGVFGASVLERQTDDE